MLTMLLSRQQRLVRKQSIHKVGINLLREMTSLGLEPTADAYLARFLSRMEMHRQRLKFLG